MQYELESLTIYLNEETKYLLHSKLEDFIDHWQKCLEPIFSEILMSWIITSETLRKFWLLSYRNLPEVIRECDLLKVALQTVSHQKQHIIIMECEFQFQTCFRNTKTAVMCAT